jgi:hypothetical protein
VKQEKHFPNGTSASLSDIGDYSFSRVLCRDSVHYDCCMLSDIDEDRGRVCGLLTCVAIIGGVITIEDHFDIEDE